MSGKGTDRGRKEEGTERRVEVRNRGQRGGAIKGK